MGEEVTSDVTPDPVSAVRRRVALFHRDRDPRQLNGRLAEAEYAAAVRAATRLNGAGEPEYNLAALAELARFRFWRGVVSGTLPGQVEADSAVGFLLGLRESSPGLIPGEMADVVGELATDARRRLSWAVDSAGRLLRLFDGTDLGPLDQAVERVTWALGTAPPDPAARVVALGRLAHAHHERHKATGEVADERKAVSARREAVRLTPPGRERARRQSLLADALMTVYERTDERACLEEALRCLEESVAGTPPGDEFRWLRYSRLGRAYRHRAGITRSPADFDAAVRWGRLARDTIDASDPDRASALRTLDRNLRARHAATGDLADLDEAVEVWRSALDRMPSDDPRRAGFLVDLSDALCHRFDHGGDPADLEGSVQACEAAVAGAAVGSRTRVRALSDLCYRLYRRFQHGDEPADLRRAVHTGRQAVGLSSLEDGEDGVVTLANLLHATVAWYDRSGDLARLDEAIALWADILAATPADHAGRGERLAGRLHALVRRFEHTGDRADLDRVFEAARECLAGAPDRGHVAESLLRVAHHLDARTPRPPVRPSPDWNSTTPGCRCAHAARTTWTPWTPSSNWPGRRRRAPTTTRRTARCARTSSRSRSPRGTGTPDGPRTVPRPSRCCATPSPRRTRTIHGSVSICPNSGTSWSADSSGTVTRPTSRPPWRPWRRRSASSLPTTGTARSTCRS
ncbi:hypothetical protein ACW7N6_01105 [Streptomyces sp. UC1A3]